MQTEETLHILYFLLRFAAENAQCIAHNSHSTAAKSSTALLTLLHLPQNHIIRETHACLAYTSSSMVVYISKCTTALMYLIVLIY